MQEIEFQNLPESRAWDTDICIVGSGPAGLTIATELAGGSVRVLVVESGGRESENSFPAALNEIESIGAPRVAEQSKVRNRVLGGSSHTWSGRCIPLDSLDYEARPWVPHSGWPIGPADLEPFFPKAAEYLGLAEVRYGNGLFRELGLKPRFDGHDPELRAVFWQFSRMPAGAGEYVRFGPRFRALDAPNVQLLTHSTVTHIDMDDDGTRVAGVEVAAPDGGRRQIRARCFVLCGGAIENARMLLASNRRDPRGVGNANGLVGRFLMDHPRATIGTFAPSAVPALQREFLLHRHASGARMQRGFSLRLDLQRGEALLNCAAWLTLHIAEDDVWQALGAARRARGRARLRHGRVALGSAGQAAFGAWEKLVRKRPLPRRFKRLDLDVLVEQAPDPESRILLSERRDALGVPLSRIDWRIGEGERRSVMRLGQAIQQAFERESLPPVALADWIRDRRPEDAVFFDPAHPMGTTRMGGSALEGVVDANSKVFGVDNLFIAGSSVFPTGGHANPTFTITALAVRLATHLRTRLS